MKKWIVVGVLFWLSCSFYTWGTIMADMHWDYTHKYRFLEAQARDASGDAASGALFGPIAAFYYLFDSNFNQHGWELWWHEDYFVKQENPPRDCIYSVDGTGTVGTWEPCKKDGINK